MELFNQEAESLVLAGMLRNPGAYWSINEVGLTPDDFLGNENRKVMRAIRAVVAEKKEPDLPLLLEELRLSDNSTTMDYLTRLTTLPCSVAQAIEYARTVKGLAISRHLASAGASIIEIAREHRADSETAVAEAESALRKVRDALPVADRSPDPADILRRLRTHHGNPSIPIRFSPTLNDLSGGLQQGHLWVIGGFSSTGKSAVAVNFLVDVLRYRDAWSMVVSPEMTQEQYMMRLLAHISGVPLRSIRDRVPGTLEHVDSLKQAESVLARAPIRIFDDIYRVPVVRSQATRMKETVGLDVLVIDFIQLLRGSAGDYSFQDMTEVILELQQMAKDLRCTVLAFSQVSNEMAKWDSQGGDQNFYSFKGSGGIKDAANMALMLKRDRVRQSPTLDIHVVKNRDGELAVIPTHMDLPTGRITEMDDYEEEE